MSTLSNESMTGGVEVALFLNESALFTLYFESCTDSIIEKHHKFNQLLDEKMRSHRELSGQIDSNAEIDQRMESMKNREEYMMRFVYDVLDSDKSINRENDNERLVSFTDFTPRPMTGTQAYHSLYAKRLAVLSAVCRTAYSDIQQFHQSRVNDSINQSSAQNQSETRTLAINQSKSSLSSVPPLLRWSLLSMFPLISAVSKLDPELRAHTLRILINILQTSPPLSLMHEDAETIAQMQNIICPNKSLTSQSSSPSNNQDDDATVQSARIGLALQRGALRHILESLLPLMDSSTSDDIVPHIEPYMAALGLHQNNAQPASVLTDDTLVCAWRHHPLPGAQQRALDHAFKHNHIDSAVSDEAHRAAMVALTTPLLSQSSSVNTSSSDDLTSPASPSSSSLPSQSDKQSSSESTKVSYLFAPSSPLPLPHYGSLATDGRYHYVHSSNGLVKYGSGQHGTLQGHVYAWNTDPFAALAADSGDHVLASYLTPQLLAAYGGYLACAEGWLYFRCTRFAATHKDILAIRIHPDTLEAHSVVQCDADCLTENKHPVWLQMTSDGDRLYFLRELDHQSHCFSLDVFESPAFPQSNDHLKLVATFSLPTGWSQFSSSHRYERTLASLQSSVQFYVGEKVEAKDSVNKWCPAEILEVTPTRVLVHYIGWASKWDEYIQIDSGRVIKQGETHPDEARSTTAHGESGRKKVRASTDADFDVEWSYSRNYIVDPQRSQQSIDQSTVAADNDWIPHTSAQSNKLESHYQSMISHAESSQSSQFTSQSSSQSNRVVALRTQRHTWSVQLNNFTQIDQLGAVHRVRRKVLNDNQSTNQSYVDDLQLTCTGQQLVLVLPAYSPANQSRKPLTRVFSIPSVTFPSADQSDPISDELVHVTDVPLVYALPTNPAPQPSINPSNNQSIHSDPQLSSLCYDRLNDELISFHSSEAMIRQWRNTGPKPELSAPVDIVLSSEHYVHNSASTTSKSLPSPRILLVSRLLTAVSHSCRHQRFHVSAQLLQPYCIDIHPDTFHFIHSFLQSCTKQLRSADLLVGNRALYVSIVTSLLRLLAANLSHLSSFSNDQPLMDTLVLLRGSLSEVIEVASNSDDASIHALRREAVDCLVAAFELFYPQPGDIVSLVQDRLAHQTTARGRDQLLDHLHSSSSLLALIHVDHQTFLSTILDSLIHHCALEAKQMLMCSDQPSRPVTLSSSLQLLLVLQRYLFAAVLNAPDSPDWSALVEKYIDGVFSEAVSSVDQISSFSFVSADSSFLQSTMQSTFIGVLLPSVLTLIPSLISDIYSSPTIITSLNVVSKSLSQLNQIIQAPGKLVSTPITHLPSTDGESTQYLTGTAPLEFVHAECHSSHPYQSETIDRSIALRGSLFMAIQFDPNCSTRNSNDSVKIKQGRWSIQCSGSNVLTRSEQPLTQSVSRWPASFVRRPGDACTIFWQIDKDAKGKEKQAISDSERKAAEWGFAVNFHGFRPHPLPQLQLIDSHSNEPDTAQKQSHRHKDTAIPLALDIHLTLLTSAGVVIRDGVSEPRSIWHVPVSNPQEDTDEQVFESRVSRVRSATEPLAVVRELNLDTVHPAPVDELSLETKLASKLNLSVLASSENVFSEKEVAFIEQLMSRDSVDDVACSPASVSPQTSSEELTIHQSMSASVNILIDTLAAHVGGRVQMTLSSRPIMLLVERAVFGTLLAHFTRVSDALKLADSLLVESEQSVDDLSSPHASSSPVLNGKRAKKRKLTDEQKILVASLTPLWQGTSRICNWLLRHGQSLSKWEGMVCEIEEQSAGTSSSEIAALSVSMLQELSPDTLALFCEAQHLDDITTVELSIPLLARIVTAEVINRLIAHALTPNELAIDTAAGLKSLSAGLLSMCRFISRISPAIHIECSQSTLSPLLEYLQAAALGRLGVEQLETLITIQDHRAQSRAKSFELSSVILGDCDELNSRQALLDCIFPFPFDSGVLAVSSTALRQLSMSFERFASTLAGSADSESYDNPDDFFDQSYASRLNQLAHVNSLTKMSVKTVCTLAKSLLACSRRLEASAASKRFTTPALPPPSQTRLFSDQADSSNVCCFAYSGSTLVQMQNYRCKTCGFDALNHRVICRSCAMTCHQGHELIANQPSSDSSGTAFCDCFLFNGLACSGMKIMSNTRARQARQRLASQCVATSIRLIRAFCDRVGDHRCSEVVCLLLEEVHTETQRIMTPSKHSVPRIRAPLFPVNHAAFDDELMFEFLATSYHLNIAASEAEQKPQAILSLFLADLIRIIMLGSTRCQRYALELLQDLFRNHSLSWFDEIANNSTVFTVIDDLLPSALGELRNSPKDDSSEKRRYFFVQANDVRTAPVDVFQSAAASLIAGLLTVVGTVILSPMMMDTPSELTANKLSASESAAAMHDVHREIHELLAAQYRIKDVYQLLIVRPVFETDDDDRFGDASSGHSVDAFITNFFEKCKTDLEHFRKAELGDEPVAPSSTTVAPKDPGLPPALRKLITASLQTGTEAVVFTGSENACDELGVKLAAKSFVTFKQLPQPNVARLRNILTDVVNPPPHSSPASVNTSTDCTDGWTGDHASGKQRLEFSNVILNLVRSTLSSKDTAWSSLMQNSILTHLSFLTPRVLKEAVSPSDSSMSLEFLSAIGALCSLAGSTGFNLPVIGSPVLVSTRESNDDFVGPSLTKPAAEACMPNHIARMCSNGTRRGIVVAFDQSGSSLKVVFHDQFSKDHRVRTRDTRLSAEKVHWHRVTTVPAISAQDETIAEKISACYPVITAKLIPAFKAVSQMLQDLAGQSLLSQSDPAMTPLSRWLMSYLHTRLVRSMILVSSDDVSLRMLVGDQQVIRMLMDCVNSQPLNQIGDLRSCGHDWSRAMESLIEYKCSRAIVAGDSTPWFERALHYQCTPAHSPITVSADSLNAPVNTLDARTALHCYVQNGNTVQYLGERTTGRSSRVKVDIDSLLPVLVKAHRPFEFSLQSDQIVDAAIEQRFYFEVSLLSDPAGISVGLAPRQLPSRCLRDYANQRTDDEFDELDSNESLDSSVGGRHLFGWSEGSVVLTCDGDKARLWHSTKVVDNRMTNDSPVRSVLRKHDLVDVQDKQGNWGKAVVIDENESKVHIHYYSWDAKYDEWLDRESERIVSCHTRTRRSRGTSSSSAKDGATRERITGQLWRESYYNQPLTSRSTVGCGLIFHPPSEQSVTRRVSVYFTVDGQFCGIAYDSSNLAQSLFPAVCLTRPESVVKMNFAGPFVYDFAHQSNPSIIQTTEQSVLQSPYLGDALNSMWSSVSEAAHHSTRHTDISSSLTDFNEADDDDNSLQQPPLHRLVSYQPVAPSAELYQRYDLAHWTSRTNFFPDISLVKFMSLLETFDDDVHRVTDHIYDKELNSASIVRSQPTQLSNTVRRAPATSPLPSFSIGTSAQRPSQSTNSFFSNPFNTLPSVSTRSRGLVRPESASLFGLPSEDAFDDDDDDFDGDADVSGQVPLAADIVHSQHAYSFRSVRGAQSTNDYEADEIAELTSHAVQDRRSNGGREDANPLALLEALLEMPAQAASSPENAQAVIQMLLQLRQLHGVLDDSGVTLRFEPAPAEAGDAGGPIAQIILSTSAAAAPQRTREAPSVPRSDWKVGTIVGISRTAKQRAVSSAVNPLIRADCSWNASMDYMMMQTGIIRAVDHINGLIAVEVSDTERSRSSLHWYEPAVLTRLIALRSTAYAHQAMPPALYAHLRHVQQRMSRQFVKQMFQMWIPQLTQLARTDTITLSSSTTTSNQLTVVSPSLRDDELMRASLMSWSGRILQIFNQLDGPPSLVMPALPFSNAANPSKEQAIIDSSPLVTSHFAVGMLDWLIENQSTYFLSCLQHTFDQCTNRCQSIKYHQDAVTFKSVMALPQPPSLPETVGQSNRVLLYECIHVPDVTGLVINCLPGFVLPLGVSLSFFTSPHFSRPCYQFQGQLTTANVGRAHAEMNLPPITLPTNTVWMCLMADVNLMKQSLNPTNGSAGPPLNMHVVCTPISERFGAGLAIAHRMVDQYLLRSLDNSNDQAISPHAQLCIAFDKCVEIVTSNHTLDSAVSQTSIPVSVRLPLLSLMIRLVSVCPRGSLGDMRSLLPLLNEMKVMFNESKIPVLAGRQQIQGEIPVYSSAFQRLVELHVAIVEHFQCDPAVPSTPPLHTPVLSYNPESDVQMTVVGSTSSPSTNMNIHTLSHLSIDELNRVNDELQRQLQALAQPPLSSTTQYEASSRPETQENHLFTDGKDDAKTADSNLFDITDSLPSSDNMMLHADFRWPEWFVEFYTAILCLKAIRAGDQSLSSSWRMTLKARRMSPIGMAADDFAETDHASRFDPLVDEQLSNLFAASHTSGALDAERDSWRHCTSLSFYSQLAQAMDKRAQILSKSPLELTRAHLMETTTTDLTTEALHEQLLAFPLLRDKSVKYVLHHASFLQTFNTSLSHHMSMFDMSAVRSYESLASLLVHCKACVFASVKLRFVSFVIEATATTSASVSHLAHMPNPTIRINRLIASKAWEPETFIKQYNKPLKSRVELASQTIIGQSYSQLRGVHATTLRRPRPRGGAPHTGFNVQFDGENVLGQAGPYRQMFTDVCRELQSNTKPYMGSFNMSPLPLLIPTPNQQHGIGESRHMFMINPAATNFSYLELFEHVGRLMGIAIRTRLLLSLDLPRLFWKQLSGMYLLDEPVLEQVDDQPWLSSELLRDLDEIDHSFVSTVLAPAALVRTEEDFDATFSGSLFFPVTRSDGVPLASQPNEASVPVTFHTFHRYLTQVIEVRLGECRQQIDAMRRGLGDILPLTLLPMLRPDELSNLVCGSPMIDLALLRRHTEYGSGLSNSTRHIQDFWAVLEEFSHEQRRAFIQFAYAQSRLPSDDAGFNAFPKIRLLIKPGRATSNVDASFPHADTCFFNIELPAYSSQDIMRTRLKQVCEMAEWGLSGDDITPMMPTTRPPATSTSSLSTIPSPSQSLLPTRVQPASSSTTTSSTAPTRPPSTSQQLSQQLSSALAQRGQLVEMRAMNTPGAHTATQAPLRLPEHTGFRSLLSGAPPPRLSVLPRTSPPPTISTGPLSPPPTHLTRRTSVPRPLSETTSTSSSSASSPTTPSSIIGGLASSLGRLFSRRTTNEAPQSSVANESTGAEEERDSHDAEDVE